MHGSAGVRAVAAALALAALCAAPARAALFDDEEARKRIEATSARLTQIERQLEDRIAALEAQLRNQGLIELFNQVELLKADTARLRGQFEVLAHEQSETQKRQRDLYVDLDTRLRKLEAGAAAPAPAAAGGAPVVPPPGAVPPAAVVPGPGRPPAPAVAQGPALAPPAGAQPAPPTALARPGPVPGDAMDEQRAYDAALELFKNGNYRGAVGAFGAFTKAYPKSPLAPSAQYWIGNAHYAQRDFRSAISAQRQLVAAYPDSQKVPDALLNIGTSQFELGDAAAARRTLEDLVRKYPQTDAAAKARQRLSAR